MDYYINPNAVLNFVWNVYKTENNTTLLHFILIIASFHCFMVFFLTSYMYLLFKFE